MDLIRKIFTPVIGVLGLPGIAIVALISGFFSKGGCATAALLYAEGSITEIHATMQFFLVDCWDNGGGLLF